MSLLPEFDTSEAISLAASILRSCRNLRTTNQSNTSQHTTSLDSEIPDALFGAPLVLLDRLSNQLGAPRLSLSLHDDALLLLERLVDEVGRALGGLLGDLLGLDRLGEGGREGDVRDRDVVQDEVEPRGPTLEVVADQLGNHLALGHKLAAGREGGVSLSMVVWLSCGEADLLTKR